MENLDGRARTHVGRVRGLRTVADLTRNRARAAGVERGPTNATLLFSRGKRRQAQGGAGIAISARTPLCSIRILRFAERWRRSVVQRDQLDGAPVDAARFVELLEERLESLRMSSPSSLLRPETATTGRSECGSWYALRVRAAHRKQTGERPNTAVSARVTPFELLARL